MISRGYQRLGVIAVLALLTALVIAWSPVSIAQEPSSYDQALTRLVFGSDEPVAAPGETLQLALVTIPVGSSLPVHTHPGVQIGLIVQGELTYHVLEGVATVNRPSEDGTTMISEELHAGESAVFSPGVTVIERPGMIHYGENLGSEPVQIYTATLFATDEPGSTVIATPLATPAP